MRRLLARLEALPAWTLVALSLLPRLAFALVLRQRFYQIDEGGFDAPAWQWATTGVLGSNGVPAAVPPVPALFFGSFYRVFGRVYLYPRLGQALLGALTAWIVGRLAEEASGSRAAGRLAWAIAAVYPFFVYYNGMLLSETLYVAASAAGLWLLVRAFNRPGDLACAAGAGAALGLSALVRVEGAGVGALVLGGAALLCAAGRFSWRGWALAGLCFAAPLAGWSARNKAATGSAALDVHGGITLLHGTVLYETAEAMDTADAMRQVERMPFYVEAQKLPDEAQRQAAYTRAALRFMRENPGETLWQWVRKFVSYWRFYPRLDKVYYQTATSRPDLSLDRRVLVAVSLLFEPWLIVLGAAGLWGLRRRPAFLPLFLFAAGSTGVHVLVVSMMRYRLPVMSVMIAAAAAWLAGRAERAS